MKTDEWCLCGGSLVVAHCGAVSVAQQDGEEETGFPFPRPPLQVVLITKHHHATFYHPSDLLHICSAVPCYTSITMCCSFNPGLLHIRCSYC